MNDYFPHHNFKIATPDMFLFSEDKLLHQGPVWHGAAIGWHKDINSQVTSLPSNHERLVGIKFDLIDYSLLLVSFYAPTSGNDDNFLESVSYLSQFILLNAVNGDKVIIGTDSNCSSKSTARRKESWRSFCEAFSLTVHSPEDPTFHHNNGTSESKIDCFLATSTLAICKPEQLCTLDTPLNLSSHDPILASIDVKNVSEKQKSQFSETYTPFNREKIVWDDASMGKYQELAAQALSSASKFWDTPGTIPLLVSLFSNLLVKCAKMSFETKSISNSSGHSFSSRALKHAESTLNNTFSRWKRAGKPSSKSNPIRLAYTTARSNLQMLRRNQENLLSIKDNNDLMYAERNDRNKVYARMKKRRGEASHIQTSLLHTPVGTFHGEDVLEGFAADAEYLGRSNEESTLYDQNFYKLCKLDNLYIFEFNGDEPVEIPPMNIFQLDHILHNRMKPGKSCDIYQLTVEHLRFCGLQAKNQILNLINRIFKDIYFLTCPQIKLGLGTALHKGKSKPITKSNSYRRITVCPILGAIIDYYVDPMAESIFRQVQSPDQLGFTSGLSYLLAAVQRGECQRWAIDKKLTCYGVSLDGEAAFPSVEREIQVRELYSIGERGGLLSYSKNTYENTECHLKQNNNLSRRIVEKKGNRQGHVRASGHFKTYINPCLTALNSSKLGFWIGPLCITALCVADDTYVLTSSPSALQSALQIVSHYGRRYQIKFNADKTKIIVTGSRVDMDFYKDTHPWKLNGETISVVDNNEHLGLVVSGLDEEQKNVDQNIAQCRKSLFALLGPAYSFKCLLSPTVQVHLWRTYNLPVLLSGISALPIRPSNIKTMTIFHNKTLRGFLKLSNSSPIPSLHFLLGELPVEAHIHINTLNLFHNVWSNPSTTVHELVKYILMMCSGNSTTWSNHVQILCLKYQLPSPLHLIEKEAPWSKESWKELVKTKVTAFYENLLREQSTSNTKMKYLNVQLHGLSGRPHPVLQNINTTQDAKKLRFHLKFLTSDFLTAERLALDQPNLNPACKLCQAPSESIEHVLVSCRATEEVRQRLLPDLLNTVAYIQPNSEILQTPSASQLTQFVLDCSSINLDSNLRIPAHNPGVSAVYKLSRDWCYSVGNMRAKLLKSRKVTH